MTDTRDTELVVETWELRERLLPRVPPDGWDTTDRLREAVCLTVECAFDGIESVESFEGPAVERERVQAVVSAETIDSEYIRVVTTPTDPSTETEDAASDGPRNDLSQGGDETTEQFDLDDALDRL